MKHSNEILSSNTKMLVVIKNDVNFDRCCQQPRLQICAVRSGDCGGVARSFGRESRLCVDGEQRHYYWWHTIDIDMCVVCMRIVVKVVGAGRGPLVRASLRAATASKRRVKIYAVEKVSVVAYFSLFSSLASRPLCLLFVIIWPLVSPLRIDF
jgi:hypothetical protein